MPRLLNFRALCAHCEKAEAHYWSTPEHTPLCKKCTKTPHEKAPISPQTVIFALCTHCSLAPASLLTVLTAAPLCDKCGEKTKGEMVPLREDVVDGIVFDRMDFSSRVAGGGGGEIEGGGEIDLSYFKTKVPLSLVGQRKRTGEAASKATSRRRRR